MEALTMGKDKKKKNDIFTNISNLEKAQKELDKEKAKIAIPCSHTNDKGKLKVEFLRGHLARCKRCGAKFDFAVVSDDDLDKAFMVVHNVLNQIKALSDDPVGEEKLIKSLGELDFNLKETKKLYRKTIEAAAKNNGNKKKNKNKGDQFGSYGASNVEFIANGKRKKY